MPVGSTGIEFSMILQVLYILHSSAMLQHGGLLISRSWMVSPMAHVSKLLLNEY